MNRIAGPTVAAALGALSLLAACGKAQPAFTWSQGPSLTVPRSGHAAVELGGSLYVLGGYSGSTLSRVERLDPGAAAWSKRADMQNARRLFAAGAVNGKIAVACGMSFTNPNAVTYLTSTELYDPAADAWQTRAACPIDPPFNSILGNVSFGGAAVNDKLYLVVANTNTPGGAAAYEYDSLADKWTPRAPPPFIGAYSAVGLNHLLYVLISGNYAASLSGQSTLAVFDPAQNLWVIGAALPNVWNASLVAVNGKLYALGGQVPQGGASEEVSEYDPAAGQWSARAGLGTARFGTGAALVGSSVWLTGGTQERDLTGSPISLVETGAPTVP